MESTTRNKILSYVPTVIEASSRGERSFDIFSRLLRERIIFLGDEIDDELANSIVAQMLLLDSENPEKDIMLYIYITIAIKLFEPLFTILLKV